jgi:YVTN family beta-propeller protein
MRRVIVATASVALALITSSAPALARTATPRGPAAHRAVAPAIAYVVNETGTVNPIINGVAGAGIPVGAAPLRQPLPATGGPPMSSMPARTRSPRSQPASPNGLGAYVANFYSNSVTPIDVATNTAEPAIKVGVAPNFIAMAP